MIPLVTTEEDEVLQANERFYQAFNRKDAGLMDEVWASDQAVSCVHPGWNVLEGRNDVLESWRGILSNPNQPRIVTGGATVTLFGDLALVVCRELVAGSPLVATNVFVREHGAWRLLHHQSGPVYQQ
jgi:ketosteroid isomerase-like protein